VTLNTKGNILDTKILFGIGLLLVGLSMWLIPKIVEFIKAELEKEDGEDLEEPEAPDHPEDSGDNNELFYHFDKVRELAPPECFKDLTAMMPRIFSELPEPAAEEVEG
jgi:hypothetical protein